MFKDHQGINRAEPEDFHKPADDTARALAQAANQLIDEGKAVLTDDGSLVWIGEGNGHA